MTYSTEVLADSPYAYWKFNEPSGTTATDSSGNGRNLAYNGTYTLDQTGLGTLGKAVVMGANSYISGSLTGTPFNSNWTFEAWYQPTNWTAGSPRGIFQYGNSGDGQWSLRHSDNSVAEGVWQLQRNSSVISSSPSASVNNTVQHVVVTFDGTNAKMYRNGSLIQTSATTAWAAGDQTMFLNYNNTASRATYGILQHVSIYTTALSSIRVSAHYAELNAIPGESPWVAPVRSRAYTRAKRPNNFGALQMGSRG